MARLILLVIVFTASAASVSQELEWSTLSDTIPLITGRDIRWTTFSNVYKSAAKTKDIISFSDCNTCKSRAHILAEHITNVYPWLTVAKVWLFADSKRKSQADVYRYKPVTYLDNGNCSKWSYHVAPVIIAVNDTFVIDPSTQTAHTKISDWAMKLIPADGKGFLVIKDKRYYIYPDDAGGFFEDQMQVWADDNESLFDDEYSRAIDETARAALGLVEPWKLNAKVNQIKELLGINH